MINILSDYKEIIFLSKNLLKGGGGEYQETSERVCENGSLC